MGNIKVLFVTFTDAWKIEVVPYEAKRHLRHGYKFLFWPAESEDKAEDCGDFPSDKDGTEGVDLLIVGDGVTRDTKYHNAMIETLQIHPSCPLGGRESSPIAAGNIDKGRVVQWHSESLDVDTPDELRPIILAALGIVG